MRIWFGIIISLFMVSCAKERPYLSGHIRRAHDAVMVPCDPYSLNVNHSCLVFSAAFRPALYVYDATAGEMVLAPMSYFPLKIGVGRATEQLISVVTSSLRIPVMFALDHSEAQIYPIKLFPGDGEKSFSEPIPQKLNSAPFKMAAIDKVGKIFGLMTYPADGEVLLMAFDRKSGAIDTSIASKRIKIGSRPSFVEIDREGKVAVFADEKESLLHILDLSNIDDVVMKSSGPRLKTIALKNPADRFYLSRRDLGQGVALYAVMLSAVGNDVALINIDNLKVESEMTMEEYPMAAYFPDANSATCCSGKNNWFSAVSIKGKLNYVVINNNGGALSLEKASTTELTSENNLHVSRLHIQKIIGGDVAQDPSLKQEALCSNHRLTYYIASYGSSRPYLHVEPVEVEAHGYSCEGEASASRFGHKPQ